MGYWLKEKMETKEQNWCVNMVWVIPLSMWLLYDTNPCYAQYWVDFWKVSQDVNRKKEREGITLRHQHMNRQGVRYKCKCEWEMGRGLMQRVVKRRDEISMIGQCQMVKYPITSNLGCLRQVTSPLWALVFWSGKWRWKALHDCLRVCVHTLTRMGVCIEHVSA